MTDHGELLDAESPPRRHVAAGVLVALGAIALAVAIAYGIGAKASSGNIAVSLDPPSNSLVSQSDVECAQSGGTVSASGTLTNVSRGLTVFSSGNVAVFDRSGQQLAIKDYSLLKPIPAGSEYTWQVSLSVGAAKVASCVAGFSLGPPPPLPPLP